MRLWHIDLIEYLPRQQLTGLWRNVCQVARNLATNGTTGSLLTERVRDYPPEDLQAYASAVYREMVGQGYRCSFRDFLRWQQLPQEAVLPERPFKDWHTRRYLIQNMFMLQEIFDCRGMQAEEWMEIEELLDGLLLEDRICREE